MNPSTPSPNVADLLPKALNKLANWRTVFAGWQLGTRRKGDPECDAVRDHRVATLMLRAETNAVLALLLSKGLFTQEEYAVALLKAIQELDTSLERFFPGFQTTDDGLSIDPRVAANTTRGWKP